MKAVTLIQWYLDAWEHHGSAEGGIVYFSDEKHGMRGGAELGIPTNKMLDVVIVDSKSNYVAVKV